jgi:hypothetical protein
MSRSAASNLKQYSDKQSLSTIKLL